MPDARKVYGMGSEQNSQPVKRFCLFALMPQDKCYCTSLRSLDVEATLYYCAEHFEECEIYRAICRRQEAERDDSTEQ